MIRLLLLFLGLAALVILTYVFTRRSDIDYYFITMGNPERLENVRTQQNTSGVKAERIDAVVGNDLDLNKLSYKPSIKNDFNPANVKREVGCYMSHLKFYTLVQNKNK